MTSVLRSLLQSPRRGRFILVLIGAVLVGAVCWYIGMDTWHAVAAGVAVAAVGLCWIAVPDHDNPRWPSDTETSNQGARRDIVQLSWALRPRYGRIRQTALGRAQKLARYRLGLHHLDLRNPDDRAAIERLIGRASYATLHATEGRMPTLAAVTRCLDRLDGLDPLRSNATLVGSARRRPATSGHSIFAPNRRRTFTKENRR